jgi:hypothetical protein
VLQINWLQTEWHRPTTCISRCLHYSGHLGQAAKCFPVKSMLFVRGRPMKHLSQYRHTVICASTDTCANIDTRHYHPSPPPQGTLLVLDEPTNHLDIPSKETLEEAIRCFEGAVIAVSHDRYFLKRIATRVLLVRRLLAGSRCQPVTPTCVLPIQICWCRHLRKAPTLCVIYDACICVSVVGSMFLVAVSPLSCFLLCAFA